MLKALGLFFLLQPYGCKKWFTASKQELLREHFKNKLEVGKKRVSCDAETTVI